MSEKISGWKSIAAHFGRDRTTVMRWAQDRDMPVHALPGGKTRTVFAYRHELEAWSRRVADIESKPEAALDATEPVPDATDPPAFSIIGRRGLLGSAAAAGAFVFAGSAGWLLHRRRALPAEAQNAMSSGLQSFRQLSPDQVAQAIADFRKAATLAPDYPEPWAQLALAYQAYASTFASAEDLPSWTLRAKEAAERALVLDPDNADAAAALASLIPQFRNWRAAAKALEGVLTRHPRAFSINRLAALLYAQTGQLHRVQECSLTALAADDAWPQLMSTMAMSNWALGRPDEADRYLAKAVDLWPRYYNVWFIRQRYLTYTGRAAQAIEMVQDTANRPIGIPDWNFEQCRLESQAALTRAPADIRAAAAGYALEAPRGVGFAGNAVQFFSVFGLVNEAFSLLRALYFNEGVRIGDTRYSIEQGQFTSRNSRDTWILWLPMSANIRKDPRLTQMLQSIGLLDYWRQTRLVPAVSLLASAGTQPA